MSEELAARKRLTFEQAEGLEPLPRQLKLREITPALRSRLWAVLHQSLYDSASGGYLGADWYEILRAYAVEREYGMIDEVSNFRELGVGKVKLIVAKGGYAKVLGFVQHVLRHPDCPIGLADEIDAVLSQTQAAYRIADGDTVFPVADVADAASAARAFSDLSRGEFGGARHHLRLAAECLTAGRFADSIRESVHAVEAVARAMEPSASTLDPALTKLANAGHVHPALKSGFSKLYGYASDEEGIRHPLIDGPTAKVDEADALYMFGACAAFVSYLIRRGAEARLI
jgi:hypothetical protein